MNKKTIMVLLVTAMLTLGSYVSANEADIIIPKEEIRGIVLDSSGSSPLKGIRIRVWDISNEVIVFKTMTDDNGLYRVPRYDTGNYLLTIGEYPVNMSVFQSRSDVLHQENAFVMVLPKAASVPITPIPVSSLVTAMPFIVSP